MRCQHQCARIFSQGRVVHRTLCSRGGKRMYARVVNSQLQPGKRDEWIAILRDSIVPAAKQQPGFKGFVVLADPNGDKGIALQYLGDRSRSKSQRDQLLLPRTNRETQGSSGYAACPRNT